MILSLPSFLTLLKGLNMFTVTLVGLDDSEVDLADFSSADLARHIHTRAHKASGSNVSKVTHKENNIVVFGDHELTSAILRARVPVRILHISHHCSTDMDFGARIDQQFYVLCSEESALQEQFEVNGLHKRNVAAVFSSSTDQWVFLAKGFWRRRQNLEGLKMVALLDEYPPFQTVRSVDFEPPDLTYERVVSAEGPYVDALRILQERLNFTTELKRRKDGVWGTLSSNGTWTGMIQDLSTGSVDLLPTSLSMTPSRFAVVDFVFPLGYDIPALLVSRDSAATADPQFDTLFSPFRTDLWLVLAAIGVVITTLAVIQRMWQRGTSLETVRFAASVLWVTSTVYFGRRLDKFPKELVWKGTLVGTLFVGNFVFIAYRASLTSAFSVPRLRRPFSDQQEFLDSDFAFLAVGGDVTEETFRDARPGSIERRIWDKKIEPRLHESFVPDTAAGLAAVRDHSNNVAFYIGLRHALTVMTWQDSCLLMAAWKSASRSPLSMAVAKGSPYRKVLSRELLRVIEDGFYHRQLYRLAEEESEHECLSTSDLRLGFSRMWLVFFFLCCGAVLGIVTLVLECASGGRRVDVFSEEKGKTFRVALKHLDAIEQWVRESGSDELFAKELDQVSERVRTIDHGITEATIQRKTNFKKKLIMSQ